MNYFTLLDLPVSFDLDLQLLEANYYKALQRYHPDKHICSSQEDKMKSIQLSYEVNQAYQTLRLDETRAVYLLSLHNILVNEEQGALQPSKEVLQEAMEDRINLEEVHNQDDLRSLQDQATNQIMGIKEKFRYSLRAEDYLAAGEAMLAWRYKSKFLDQLKKLNYDTD